MKVMSLSLLFILISLIAESKILFTSTRDGNSEVYVMDSDGSNQINLTNNPAEDNYPTWSPNGSVIAFCSNRNVGIHIFTMNADGTNQIELTTGSGDLHPDWSPDGKRIVFQSFHADPKPHRFAQLQVHIFAMNADGSKQKQLMGNAGETPSWSPDGNKIAFVSIRDDLSSSDIYLMDVDGSNQIQITDDNATILTPVWSPDGTEIAYGSNGNIFVMDRNGMNQRQLTNKPWNSHPSWSPDSQIILYESLNNKGNLGIYSVTVGSGVIKLIHRESNIDNSQPEWYNPNPRTVESHYKLITTLGKIKNAR